MRRHVRRRRTPYLSREVVPPDPVTRRVLARIETVAPKVRVVEPTHKGDLVVDDEDLLVVSMQWALMVIQQAMDACTSHEFVAGAFDVDAPDGRPRDQRTGPKQNPNIDSSGEFGQQFADRGTVLRQAA